MIEADADDRRSDIIGDLPKGYQAMRISGETFRRFLQSTKHQM